MNKFAMVKLLACGTAASVLLFCPGCATSPQTSTLRTDYREMPLSPSVFRVIYSGKDSGSADRLLDLTLLGACHLVKERDLSYFAVIDEDSSVTGETVFYSGLNHMTLQPRRGLVIKCFDSKPKRVFCFDCAKLEQVLHEKLHLDK